ncbi:MAG: hypothetical protein NTV40_07615 [Solirubrobacterales bacterium]|nr:hypothetical protein [Solirubrobacterales bacterium]
MKVVIVYKTSVYKTSAAVSDRWLIVVCFAIATLPRSDCLV